VRLHIAPAIACLVTLTCAASSSASAADTIAPAPASALTLFDAYLAEAARTVPLYRTDLRAGGDPQHIPLGRFFGQGSMIGPFTYRPKTYDELTREERAELIRDPKFHAFLIASREQTDDPRGEDTPVAGGTPLHRGARHSTPTPVTRPAVEKFSISPGEMLQRRPLFVVLPPP